MFKLNLLLYLFIIFNYFHYGGTINYNPYATANSNQPHHLLHATNLQQQPATNEYSLYQQQQQNHVEAQQSEQNLQGNSNYQQLYRYYYAPPPSSPSPQYPQQQQQLLTPSQPTQIWSGPPIVVEDDFQQHQHQQPSTTDIPRTLYQHSTITPGSNRRNSKVLPSTIYNPQTTRSRTQFNYNNNNNNNIVYHRDFRHQIDAIPGTQLQQQYPTTTTQQDIVSWNNQQQQLLEPHQQPHQQQPQQFYATNTNLRYNGISNDLTTTLRKEDNNLPDYREHFKRYLENNPRRIRPIY